MSDMQPLVGREGTVAGVGSWVEVHADGDWQSDGEPQHWSWPAKCLELVRSSSAQRLARIQAAVGRLVATASGPARLLQLQRRMLRATRVHHLLNCGGWDDRHRDNLYFNEDARLARWLGRVRQQMSQDASLVSSRRFLPGRVEPEVVACVVEQPKALPPRRKK